MSRNLRTLPAPNDGEGRVESGAVQFGNDWPGTFVRGDNAQWCAHQLKHLLDKTEKEITPAEWVSLSYLRKLQRWLEESKA